MVDLLQTLDLGGVVGEVLVDGEAEVECTALVHAFVRLDGEGEVEDIVRVREGHFHRASEGKFLEIFQHVSLFSDKNID